MTLILEWLAPAPPLELVWLGQADAPPPARPGAPAPTVSVVVGPRGASEAIADPGDLTLIFENKLI